MIRPRHRERPDNSVDVLMLSDWADRQLGTQVTEEGWETARGGEARGEGGRDLLLTPGGER